MRKISFFDVFGLDREAAAGPPPAVGDVVATGRNQAPRFRVLAVVEDKAWIRSLAHGSDHVVPLSRLRKLDQPAA